MRMRARRGAVGAVVAIGAVLAGLGVPATSSAAVEDPGVATSLSLRNVSPVGMFKDHVRTGYRRLTQKVTVFATLTEEDAQTPVAGAVLRLERRFADEATFTEVDAAVTSPEEGWASLDAWLKGPAQYRVVYDGDATHLPTSGGPVEVRLERDLNAHLVLRGTRQRPRPVLAGVVHPGWGGREVVLQRRRCDLPCAFRTIATTTAGRAGHWRFHAAIPRPGRIWNYRAAVVASDGFVESTSVRLRTLKPPDRPGIARLRGLR